MTDNYGELVRETVSAIEDAFPQLRFASLYGMFPLQGVGTYEGKEFYFRFRHGTARLEVYPDGAEAIPGSTPELVGHYSESTDDGTCKEPGEMVRIFAELVTALAPHDSDTNPSGVEVPRATVDSLVKEWEERRQDEPPVP
jgi:hypothetical protein